MPNGLSPELGKTLGRLAELTEEIRHVSDGTISAVVPEGWEKTVKKMLKHPEIDNPWALAWWMQEQGYEPKASAEASTRIGTLQDELAVIQQKKP